MFIYNWSLINLLIRSVFRRSSGTSHNDSTFFYEYFSWALFFRHWRWMAILAISLVLLLSGVRFKNGNSLPNTSNCWLCLFFWNQRLQYIYIIHMYSHKYMCKWDFLSLVNMSDCEKLIESQMTQTRWTKTYDMSLYPFLEFC